MGQWAVDSPIMGQGASYEVQSEVEININQQLWEDG